MHTIKLVIIGSKSTGKSSMLLTFTTNTFPDTNTEDGFQDMLKNGLSCNIMVDGTPIALKLHDTTGIGSDHPQRSSLYEEMTEYNSYGFIICYDIANINSFHEIRTQWLPELYYYNHDPNCTLLGLKSDQRDNLDSTQLVPKDDVNKFSNDIGAGHWSECSALQKVGLLDAIQGAIRTSWHTGFRYYRGYNFKQNPVKDNIVKMIDMDDESRIFILEKNKQHLLIYGYVRMYFMGEYVAEDIMQMILCYILSSRRQYFKPAMLEASVSSVMPFKYLNNRFMPKYWWHMVIADALVILMYNIWCIVFSIEIYKQIGNLMYLAPIGMTFSFIGLILILVTYFLLFYDPRIKYYSSAVYVMLSVMELFINVPMLIIQLVYVYNFDMDISYSFYVCIIWFICFTLYKWIVMTGIWCSKNYVKLEECYTCCLVWHLSIWILFIVPSMLTLAIYYMKQVLPLSIALMTICGIVWCCVPCIVLFQYWDAAQQQRRCNRQARYAR